MEALEIEEIEALEIEEMICTTHENGMRCTFRNLVRVIRLDTSFDEAWEKFPIKRLFMESYISKERVRETFERTRRSIFERQPEETSGRICIQESSPRAKKPVLLHLVRPKRRANDVK